VKQYWLAALVASLIGFPTQAESVNLSVVCRDGKVEIRFSLTDPVESLKAWVDETEIVNERNPKVPYIFERTYDAPARELAVKVQADKSISTASVACSGNIVTPQVFTGWSLLVALLAVGGFALALRRRRKSQPA